MKKEEKTKKKARTPGEMLEAYVPDIPDVKAAKLARAIMNISTLTRPAKFSYSFDRRELKGRQVLILSQHASTNDPYYLSSGYTLVQPNAVMSMHNVLIPVLYRIMLKAGVVLKALYEPDLKAMRHLMRLHKKGASFLIFPEGIQSLDGTTQPVHPATARLVKKLGMDTVLCTSHGAYLCNPRFDTYKRKGRIEYHFEILFTKEELRDMSEEELYSRLMDKFRYNDFAWNKEHRYRYKGKVPLAHGLDNMLFICPRCKRQYSMKVEGDRLVCSCGSAVTVNDRYDLVPEGSGDFPFKRIDQWNRWQRDVIAEEVSRDDFMMQEDADYLVLNLEDLSKGRYLKAGEGKLTLDREALRYAGTKNGEEVEFRFDISRMPSNTVTSKLNANHFYYDGEYYQFVLKGDTRHIAKIMMATELLHDMGDPERSKARRDAESYWE